MTDCSAFGQPGLFERPVHIPAVGNNPAGQLDARASVPRLSQDVLVHTWDLARAVGADDQIDQRWCALFLSQLPSDPAALSDSGMFAAAVAVNGSADEQTTLLARLGRDPAWRPGYR